MKFKSREDVNQLPIRYFMLNSKTGIAHIYGYCQQTRPRAIPIRLFDSYEELEKYAQRPLKMCVCCERQRKKEER